jgi:hypothetical protein
MHRLLFGLLLTLVVACAGSEAGTPTPPSPDGGGKPPAPSAAEMRRWIEDIVAEGIRRPGYPADARVEQRIRDWLTGFGVEDVRLEPVTVTRWMTVEGASSVEVCRPACDGSLKLTVFPTLAVAAPRTIDAPLVRYDGSTAGLAGKIVVLDYPMARFVPGALADQSLWVHDPDADLSSTSHPNSRPQTSKAASTVVAILRARPAAIVCALDDFFDTPYVYGVPSLLLNDSIPVVYASPSARTALLQALAGSAPSARLTVVATSEEVVAHNVVGRLRSDKTTDIVLFGSHHDGPFFGATEDAAGVSLVLAQARYWSQVPASQRPFEFRFVLTAGHLLRSRGAEAWVTAHPDLAAKTVLNVHLETPAQEYDVNSQNAPVNRNRIEPHWFYVSNAPVLVNGLKGAVQRVDYRRTMAIDPKAFPDGPPSDAKAFFSAGIPILSHISNPAYYLTIEDKLDKVSDKANEELSRVVIDVVWGLAGQTPASLRAAVR